MPPALRRRIVVLAGVLAVALVAFGFALARSRTPSCSIPPPDVQLPAPLSALGEFSQPFDSADLRALDDAAIHAASALYGDLTGAHPGLPIAIAAVSPARYDALVLPLSETTGGPGSRASVVGLAVFLQDCGGRGWFDRVDDLLHRVPGALPIQFPTVTADQARARLDTQNVRLVYSDTPLDPRWQTPDGSRRIEAGSASF